MIRTVEYNSKGLSKSTNKNIKVRYFLSHIKSVDEDDEDSDKAYFKLKRRVNYTITKQALIKDRADNTIATHDIALYSFHIDAYDSLVFKSLISVIVMALLSIVFSTLSIILLRNILLILSTIMAVITLYTLYDQRFITYLVFKDDATVFSIFDIFRKPYDSDGVISTKLVSSYVTRQANSSSTVYKKLLLVHVVEQLRQDEQERDTAVGSFVEDITTKYPLITLNSGTSEEVNKEIVKLLKTNNIGVITSNKNNTDAKVTEVKSSIEPNTKIDIEHDSKSKVEPQYKPKHTSKYKPYELIGIPVIIKPDAKDLVPYLEKPKVKQKFINTTSSDTKKYLSPIEFANSIAYETTETPETDASETPETDTPETPETDASETDTPETTDLKNLTDVHEFTKQDSLKTKSTKNVVLKINVKRPIKYHKNKGHKQAKVEIKHV